MPKVYLFDKSASVAEIAEVFQKIKEAAKSNVEGGENAKGQNSRASVHSRRG
jgi:hypothetical protein